VSELVVAVYDRGDTAEQVLGVLRSRPDELPVDLSSAAIVRVGADGGFTVITTDRPGTGRSFSGMLWEAFFTLVFLVPASHSAYGANLGGLFGAIDRAGLDEGFRANVRSALSRGRSGLTFLALDWDPALVLDQLYLQPDVVVQASLSPEQDAELVQELGGARPICERRTVP
jgi:uncharacterized membrane protein